MPFNPCQSSKNIIEFYKRYILTTFKMKDNDYNQQLQEILSQEGSISKGPYVSISSPYKKGHSLQELVNTGKSNKNITKMEKLSPKRPLYAHQEDALTKIKEGKSIIVSTGTGSGKTESFLIPIINELLEEEQKKGTLTAGVRALIIYPMNALVNDQIGRMEEILAGTHITFGYYTGETENEERKAQQHYKDIHDKNAPANELLSREKMRNTPPHILITNYAMLEFLLLRPDDNDIFKKNSATLKYIIFDEAHSYNGAKAIEVACLVKRVKALLNGNDIQFILTSATLGDPSKSTDTIINFAQNLCNACEKAKFDRDSIIMAQTAELKKPSKFINIPVDFYTNLTNYNSEQEKLAYIQTLIPLTGIHSLPEALFELVSKDKFYYNFRNFLKEGPKSIPDITQRLQISEQHLIDFIAIASQASKDDTRLFEAKYHLFVKGIDGIFITLNPSKKLFIKKMKTYKENPDDTTDTGEKVFQVSFCSNCNALYIIGKENAGNHTLEQPSYYESKPDIFLLNGSLEDEEIETNNRQVPYVICGKCGEIHQESYPFQCKCGEKYKNNLTKINYANGTLHVCACCHHKNTQRSILRPYLLGSDAATAVISSGLYNELPGEKVETTNTAVDFPDKQFLTFSDSRQAAAFFAPYLQGTYQDNLVKRIITDIVQHAPEQFDRGIPLQRLCELLAKKFTDYKLFQDAPLKEAWIYVLGELSNFKAKNSLEKKGILKFELNLDDITLTEPIPIDIGNGNTKTFTGKEMKDLFNILVRTMIRESAFVINCQDITFTADDIKRISVSGQEQWRKYQREGRSDGQVSSWASLTGGTNPRLRFICKVLEENNKDCRPARKLLTEIWNFLSQKDIIIRRQRDNYYGLNLSKVRVKSADKLYICPKCNNVVPFNVKGICSYTGCKGTEPLQEYDYKEILKDDHYRNMYYSYNISPMEVREHTAQLSSEQARDYQNQFKDKIINVLSCSTTFELGVDVGSLQTVFMRDMPPTPANYAQRAGRAGRSAKAAAYALTFCQNSPHDLNYFKDPLPMILGKIEPPIFDINNDKIVLRHIFASAFSFFWKAHTEKYYKTISEFFGNDGFKAMEKYLGTKPEPLKDYLLKIVPQNIQNIFGIDEFKWVNKLFNDSLNTEELGYFNIAKQRYDEDITALEEERRHLFRETIGTNNVERHIKTIKEENTITFLSKNNLIPKYGFPVDTVDLDTENNFPVHNKSSHLRLSRDLFYAISEYAPESEVVADGYLYKSQYIKKINNYGWPVYKYSICPNCQTLNRILDTQNKTLEKCTQCDSNLPGNYLKYIIPKFGFQIAKEKIKKVGINKPEKTYRGDIHYIGNGQEADFHDEHTICGQKIQITGSVRDTLVVLNESKFYVCETCGYATIDNNPMSTITCKHTYPNGIKNCTNTQLNRFSLGHEILTDVTVLKFPDISVEDEAQARTILYSLIEGFSHSMNIDRRELSGCLQRDNNQFKCIIFDNTPGGAGYVKHLRKADVLKKTLREGFRIIETCSCGQDTACYNCLCNYYNQKYHDILKREYALTFYKHFADHILK